MLEALLITFTSKLRLWNNYSRRKTILIYYSLLKCADAKILSSANQVFLFSDKVALKTKAY